MLEFLINLQNIVNKLRNINIKIEKKENYDYYCITSDAIEITIYCKDKTLSDIIKFLINLYEKRKTKEEA